ncbi:hypothetical protein ACQPZJ_36825 [Actinoplanes sp. CA-054009]
MTIWTSGNNNHPDEPDDGLVDDPMPPANNRPPRQSDRGSGPADPAQGVRPSAPANPFAMFDDTTAPPRRSQPAPAANPEPAPSPLGINVPPIPMDTPAAPPPSNSNRTMTEPAPLPIPGGMRPGQVQDSTVRIGLWGSTRSGKSTYLAALPIAAMQGGHGSWVVAGTDDLAADYLNQSVNRLVVQRRFPRPNRVIEPISWTFHGTPPPAGWGRAFFSKRRPVPDSVDFRLELHDPPGSFYENGRISEEAIEHLANANGLIYLMNPVLNRNEIQMNFEAFFSALQRLTTRMSASGQMDNGKLPHYVAVCVTKFDDEHLFRHVVSNTNFVRQDQDGQRLPRIPQERSAEYFAWVCERLLGGNTELVRSALSTHFHEDRINYFATSAIGFRLNSNNIFDFRDFRNTEQIDGDTGLRGMPRPINVLEPLIFLERRIRAARR